MATVRLRPPGGTTAWDFFDADSLLSETFEERTMREGRFFNGAAEAIARIGGGVDSHGEENRCRQAEQRGIGRRNMLKDNREGILEAVLKCGMDVFTRRFRWWGELRFSVVVVQHARRLTGYRLHMRVPLDDH